jgi:hypothetical protein
MIGLGVNQTNVNFHAMPREYEGMNQFDNLKFNRLGFGVGWDLPGVVSWRWLRFPYWMLVAASMMPALIWCWIHRPHFGYPPGHCKKCGYDLRASKNRCPECGNPIPADLPAS